MSRTGPDPRVAVLARKQRIALALLGAFALLLVVAEWLRRAHPSPWFDGLATVAEAALVGGLADWFAVVALFRHPLGLPIPHTAIIPAKKDAIGASLADFICDNFLGRQQVIAKLEQLDVARWLARRMADENTAANIGGWAIRVLPHVLKALHSEELHAFIHTLVRARLRQANLATFAAFGLRRLTAEHRHQDLVDSALAYVGDALRSESTRREISRRVSQEVWAVLRYLGLKDYVADKLTAKLIEGMTTLVTDMARDRDHELRLKIAGQIEALIVRLETDPQLQQGIDDLRDKLLERNELGDYLRGLWNELMAWVDADVGKPDSVIAANIAGGARRIGTLLLEDAAMREWINANITEAVDPLIGQYREDIRGFIIERIRQWSAEELTRELELSVGADLQYIRYNGTAVGAAIGGLIFLVLHGANAVFG